VLRAGTTLGPYEIVAPLGAGGMGEVYRARDPKLGRDVALKILPATFTTDPERLARFRREAQLLASLNHPHIGAIYGLDEANGQQILVLELVDGESLDTRLACGAIPVDEALAIARQVAEALESAHEKGVIHRDLKPANIVLTKDGHVKVLDFGLAKPTEPASEASRRDLMNSPTITSPAMMTGIGVILGTAAYMSPEQARGKQVGKGADIWAFGCVMYEMLTGRRAFAGDEISDVLASVLAREPDLAALPTNTSPSLRRLIRRCLQKDPNARLHDIADARLDLEEAQREPDADTRTIPQTARRGERYKIGAIAVAALMVGAATALVFRPTSSASPVPEMRLDITTPPTTEPASFALSPDGQKIVFVATSDSGSQLWLRPLDVVSARPLARTEGSTSPFWSPNSESVGFFAGGKLKRIDLDGGSVQTLAEAPGGSGGTWNNDDVILFTPRAYTPIQRISAKGGQPTAATQLETPGQSNFSPRFLPDGRHFLYYVPTTAGGSVVVGQLDGLEHQRLLESDAAPVVRASGHLLFARQDTLFAQAFDPVRIELMGAPAPIAEHIFVGTANGSGAFSAAVAGPVAYRTAVAGGARRQFAWFDRSGKEIGKVGAPDRAFSYYPSLSKDGRHVALWRVSEGGRPDIWLLDIGRGVLNPFTFDGSSAGPIWSPDGSRIVFARGLDRALVEKEIGGAPGSERVLPNVHGAPTAWSSDGRFLLYTVFSSPTDPNIWAVRMDGDGKPFPVVQTNFAERDGEFAPDGKWIAYRSNKSGRFEVYIQPFPESGGDVQVSTNGGAQPRWGRDGKELFYIALDGKLSAVPIQFAADGRHADVGRPVPLFPARVGDVTSPNGQQYDISRDGTRFLINTATEEAASPITIILNWKPKPN
jgi:serine/threonine protein kinase